jgi:hypothetical protein
MPGEPQVPELFGLCKKSNIQPYFGTIVSFITCFVSLLVRQFFKNAIEKEYNRRILLIIMQHNL